MMTRLLLPLCVAALAVSAERDTRIADAAQRGDRVAVEALLREKADVNSAGGDGSMARHWAADHAARQSLARTLLRAGANVNAVTRVGALTPLHIAATSGAADVVEALLTGGAQPNTAASDGATPTLAAAAGDARSVGLLLDRGADPNALEAAHGQTALMFAASANRASVIKVLLARRRSEDLHQGG